MPEVGCSCVLKLGIFLEEHAYLEDEFIEIFFLRVVVRFEGLDGPVVLKDWIILFLLF